MVGTDERMKREEEQSLTFLGCRLRWFFTTVLIVYQTGIRPQSENEREH